MTNVISATGGIAVGEIDADALGLADEINCEGETEGETDGLAEILGETLGLLDADGLCEGEAEGDWDGDAEGEILPPIDGLTLGDTDALGD